jgi:hypothetical protein
MPDRPGWGIVPNEAAIRARPPKGGQVGIMGMAKR